MVILPKALGKGKCVLVLISLTIILIFTLYNTGNLDHDKLYSYMRRTPLYMYNSTQLISLPPSETKKSQYKKNTTINIKTRTETQNISTKTHLQRTTTLKMAGDNRNVTIVTLFVDLKRFKKGPAGEFTTETYKKWFTPWARLENNVVAFFDDVHLAKQFRNVRKLQHPTKTKIFTISRKDLLAFKHVKTIENIYSNTSYPKHHPNTVVAEYSCAMSAKYDALERAIKMEDLKDNKYFAWLDIGYFRNFLQEKYRNHSYYLTMPSSLNDANIYYSRVGDKKSILSHTPWDIIKHNLVWVAGGMVLGTRTVVEKMITSYRLARDELLAQNMSSTDQQVIAALYSGKLQSKPEVNLIDLTCPNDGWYHGSSAYFCLGFYCKRPQLK